VVEEHEDDNIVDPEVQEAVDTESEGLEPEDQAKVVHDEEVVSAIAVQAVAEAAEIGILMLDEERRDALGLFPKVRALKAMIGDDPHSFKVAGLARRLHDVTTQQVKFEGFINVTMPESSKKHLDRRVPTRWNSDLTCLAAHVYFAEPVQLLTNDPKMNLKCFALTAKQWILAKQLVGVLAVHTLH
jgi:hypothetical protein